MRRAQKVDLWAHQSVALNYKKSGVGFTKSASDFPAGALIRVDRCLMKGSDTENVLHVLLQMHPHAHQDVDNLVRLLTRAISVCSALRPMIDSGVHPPPPPRAHTQKTPGLNKLRLGFSPKPSLRGNHATAKERERRRGTPVFGLKPTYRVSPSPGCRPHPISSWPRTTTNR